MECLRDYDYLNLLILPLQFLESQPFVSVQQVDDAAILEAVFLEDILQDMIIAMVIKTFRITTGTARTSDEYGVYFVDWLRVRDIHVSEIDAVIIASVVPKVMHSLTSGIIKYLNIQPIIVAPGIKTGINIAIPEPKTLGADRLVDAVAAYELYGGPSQLK